MGKKVKEEVISEDNYSPYCKICSGCGMEGCCSPLACEMHSDGDYCESYLNDLKCGYESYNLLTEILYDEEKYPEIVKIINEIDDKMFDKHYKIVEDNDD